ncbi:MAG: magnesium transporter [Nanoarchaeota archaeon]|nr:magnesium transporter [Nanoarchaeota archaeon]
MKESKKLDSNLKSRLILERDKRIAIFREIQVNNQGFVLLSLSKPLQRKILDELNNKEIDKLLRFLDPDEVTDLLQKLKERRRNKIIDELSENIREKVEFLLKFNPKTAAGMMSLDYIEIEKKMSFEQISRIVEKHEKRTGKFPAILVVEDGFLLGELHGHSFALAKPKEKIGKYTKHIPHIKYDKDQSEILDTFKKHPHNKIVVLDEDDSIMGVIYSDDILKIIQKQSVDTLYDFAGVSEEERVLDPVWAKVKHRYKWLILNLATAFLAASVIMFFQDTISALVLLAVYMPVVAGMGGNAGGQTLAVVVRGLTLKEIDLKTGKKVIMNEIMVGTINGIINGILVASIAFFWNKNPMLGLVVGSAMFINLIIAGFFGSTVPLLMKRLGKDPATSATIFMTTATDVLGFLIFLGLATIIL